MNVVELLEIINIIGDINANNHNRNSDTNYKSNIVSSYHIAITAATTTNTTTNTTTTAAAATAATTPPPLALRTRVYSSTCQTGSKYFTSLQNWFFQYHT